MNLYYLGPEETFSHRAASRMAKPGEDLVPCVSFRDVFRKTAGDPGSAAVVPFENTTQGPVTEVMDLLAAFPTLTAVACNAIPVHQHLLTRDLTTPVQKILSKAEALAQCRATLNDIYPGIPLIAVASTAEAARLASEDATLAAIAGETTGHRYGLVVRRPDVQDIQGNTTRFFRLESRGASRDSSLLPPTHALLYVMVNDRPSALLDVLAPLKEINLTFIQSRPIPGEKWKYAFYLELLVGGASTPFATVLSHLKSLTRETRLLGAYTITSQPTIVNETNTTALSSLRAMIADIDVSLIQAFAARCAFRLNPKLYVHAEPIPLSELAQAFAIGDVTMQTRALRRFYLTTVVPYLAHPGEDADPREALYTDTNAIAALARRFRFATKVIARKRVELAPELRAAAATGDPAQVEHALLNEAVEAKVLERAKCCAESHGFSERQTRHVVALYHDYLLPLSRLIQVYVILSQS